MARTKIQMIGLRFGRLTVVSEHPVRAKCGFVRYVCACECGGETIASGACLRSGHTTSCSCVSREKATKLAKDLTGQRFGKLLVVARAGQDSRGRAKWLCQCDCGGTTESMGYRLRGGFSSSCGCMQREGFREYVALKTPDLVGRRFSWLAVVARLESDGRAARWLCKCDCGKETKAITNSLLSGSKNSCGCARKSTNQRPALMPHEARQKFIINSAKRRAKVRGAIGSHTKAEIDDLFKRQRGCCASCRGKFKNGFFHRDHIMPLALGGTNDILNIQLLCAPCNLKKNARDPFEWAQENGRLL
jgi:hypothetical protein